MKIVHLCLSNFYIEGFGYQENILPKYHLKSGYDVTIIASRFSYSKNNGEPTMADVGEYRNPDGIKVIRLDYKYKWLNKLNEKIKVYKGTYETLEREKPDIIFCHGIQFLDLLKVTQYVKNNPNCRLITDSHAADINSGKNYISREVLHKKFYKTIIQKALPYIEKVFVLAPGCKAFAMEMYDIPDNKMEYLYLGADTDRINFINKDKIKQDIRRRLDINHDDFVFITGGKLNKDKNIKLLLNAFSDIKVENIKLIIFGVFSNDINEEMLRIIEQDPRVKYIGWINGNDVYDYYLSSDVAIFPGTKSALWEQAICTGLPLICSTWPGMKYVDVGGNCLFVDVNSKQDLVNSMNTLISDSQVYSEMSNIAITKGYERFSYERISTQALN